MENNKKPGGYLKAILFFGLAMYGVVTTAASIVGSKHDLSSATTGKSDEICVFCHTPHGANIDVDNTCGGDPGCLATHNDADDATRASAPLWNRRLTDTSVFQAYISATLNSKCDDTPSPLSLVCLSCHDSATSAIGGLGPDGAVSKSADTHFLMNEPNRGDIFADGRRRCGVACHSHSGDYNEKLQPFWEVGPDLTNDHPISMTYPTPEQDPDFFIPPNLQKGWSDVKLFKGRIECPSCHNPHDPANVPFLRKSMENSGLCTTCHNK